MKTILRVGVWSCCWVVGVTESARAAGPAEFVLTPIRASGTYSIVGDEIRLMGAGQRVFLEIRVEDWSPNELKIYQAQIDAAGYASGTNGLIVPAVQTCAGPNVTGNNQCVAAFAPGARCNVPDGPGFRCSAGWLDRNRANWVFFGHDWAAADVDTSSESYRYAAVLNPGDPALDTGASKYGGDLVLDVPPGATGTFTIGFIEGTGVTFMADESNTEFKIRSPLATLKIVISCSTNANCDDGNACTNDVCNVDGTCSNVNNYNSSTHCCNPANGALQVLSDGNQCTDDVCNTATGQVTHPFSPALITPCGNPANLQCDKPDSCDGAGNCNARLEPNGTACGSPTNTACDGADTCNGAGACVTNIRPAGTACGSPSDTVCDNPDTCNGLGACLVNNEANGFPCSTNQFCVQDERCQSAVCTGGTPRNCADLLTCTPDVCNEGTDQCDHIPLNAGTCLIDGVCYLAGDLRPGNTCEECDPATSTSTWTVKPDGSACNDGNACTGTGRPGIDDDTCTAGVCLGETDPECNDQCEFAVPAIVGLNLSDNSSAGLDDGEASCQPDSNHDVWFEYTAACDGITFASTSGSTMAPSNDGVLSVYSDCPSLGGVEIACDDDSGVGLQAALNFATTLGTTYRIRVAGFEDNKGPIHLNIRPVDDCLIDGVCYGYLDLNPANDCQACIPDLSTTQWSPRPEGSACGNLLDTECDSPDACDGAGVCEINYKPDGIPCSDESPPICDKDLCNTCTKNLCQSGVCTHPPEPAGLPCGSQLDDDCDNPNTCNGGGGCANNLEGAGHACGDQSDTQCDNPNVCDGLGICLDNFEIDGAPCDDDDICTGDDVCETGECLGSPALLPPLVVAEGSRALNVTPQAAFAPAPVALRVTSPTWPCLDKYIDENGQLVPDSEKVFMLPSEWGTVIVQDPDIYPSSTYHVEAECGAYRSAPGIDDTWRWGDTDDDGDVDAIDIANVVNKFKMLPGAVSTEIVDFFPCMPDGIINALDIAMDVYAFKLYPYPCSQPCH